MYHIGWNPRDGARKLQSSLWRHLGTPHTISETITASVIYNNVAAQDIGGD